MHSASNNIQFMHYSDANDVIDEFFEVSHSSYKRNFEASMKGNDLYLIQFN